MTDRNCLRFGRPDKPSDWRPLRAGPLSLYYDPNLGDLRYLRLGDRELVRRIYVAVRDRNWGTIPAVLSGHHLEERDGGFLLRFLALHRQREIAFAWAAEITGDAEGRITFEMSGQALSTFMRNRIGICVLHPAHESAGQACTVEHADGSTEDGAFPLYIAPHQPLMDIRRLFLPLGGEARATLTFSGDVFEMEDQRNWTDASFKTYSTPLALPYPAEIRANTKVEQSVTLSLSGVAHAPAPTDTGGPVTVTIGRAPLGPRPAIGFGLAAVPHADDAVALLHDLLPSHLRLDLDLAEEWRESLAQGAAVAAEVGAPLELALMLPEDPEDGLRELGQYLTREAVAVARVLAFGRENRLGDDRLITATRAALDGLLPRPEFGGGTDAYFTDLNRGRPALAGADLATYCLTPQVHAFDYASLVETLPTQALTVASARRLYPGLAVSVSPVTLKPRLRPDRDAPPSGPDGLPGQYDARQKSLFAAAWAVGSLKYLAQAAVHSATYFETVGPGGLLDADTVYPLYHAFADVLEPDEAVILPTLSEDALRVEALALRHGSRTRVLVANLTLDPLSVRLRGLGAALRLRPLDEHTAASALTNPAEYRAQDWGAGPVKDGEAVLDLPPCGIVTLETW